MDKKKPFDIRNLRVCVVIGSGLLTANAGQLEHSTDSGNSDEEWILGDSVTATHGVHTAEQVPSSSLMLATEEQYYNLTKSK